MEYGDLKYVHFHRKLGDDPIEELKMGLAWKTSESVNLLLGQKGCGKSTELRRLKGMLEETGFEVFLCDMEGYINKTEPLEVGDVLISIMGAMSDAMEERFGSGFGLDYWSRMTKFLSQDVNIEQISLIGPGFNLKASLLRNPDFKEALRKRLRLYPSEMTNQAWKFASEMVDRVRQQTNSPNKQVVLLVDSLEKQQGVGQEKTLAVYDSMKRLFTADAHALSIPKIHMVYSIPPYLPALTPNMGSELSGAALFRLPSVHVLYQAGTPDNRGLDVMKEVVEKRFAQWQTIFTSDQMSSLAAASGGDFRAFFRMIQRCLTKGASRGDPLPFSDDIIYRAQADYKSEFLPIAKDDARWLLKIAASKKVELEQHNLLSTLARFLDGKLVLNYRNGNDWYDVHPLLKEEIRAILGDEARG
ncbi:MAG: hypothetical protein H7839_17500 [Magnetococcus sp. YQC-5]